MGIPILARLHLYTECLWWEFLHWQDCIFILNVYDGNSYTGKTASVYWMFRMGIPIMARLHLYTECLWWEFLNWQDCIFILNVYDGNSNTGKTTSVYWMLMIGIPILARLHLYTECLLWEFLYWQDCIFTQIAKFMGPTWGPPGSCRPQMLAPWTLLSGYTEMERSVILPSWIHKSGQ